VIDALVMRGPGMQLVELCLIQTEVPPLFSLCFPKHRLNNPQDTSAQFAKAAEMMDVRLSAGADRGGIMRSLNRSARHSKTSAGVAGLPRQLAQKRGEVADYIEVLSTTGPASATFHHQLSSAGHGNG